MKKCIACQVDIEDLASVCPVCKSHQRNWQNWLPYVAGLSALIALIGTALAYIIPTGIHTYEESTWRSRVTVVEFVSNRSITVLNASPFSIYLESVAVNVRIPNPLEDQVSNKTYFESIHKVVNPHEFVAKELGPRNNDQYELMSGMTDAAWNRALRVLLRDKKECVFLEFATGSELLHSTDFLARHGETVRHVDGTATVYFVSGKDGARYAHSFAVKGLPMIRKQDECANLFRRFMD